MKLDFLNREYYEANMNFRNVIAVRSNDFYYFDLSLLFPTYKSFSGRHTAMLGLVKNVSFAVIYTFVQISVLF